MKELSLGCMLIVGPFEEDIELELELTKHITPHANCELLLKRSYPHSLLSSSATILYLYLSGMAMLRSKS